MRLCLFVLLAGVLCAQETIAPTPASVGPVRGEDAGNYNIIQSWEVGYRLVDVSGSEGAYRAEVNYGNGIRLLGSSLTINSKDGHGRYFDEIVLTSQGLGNDPYESAMLRVRKKQIYDYSMSWRLNNYYNPNLVVSLGEHAQNTQRRWQDHELTLFPDSWYRFRAGYSRNVDDGPALTTEQTLGQTVTPALLYANLRQQYNSYFVGGDIEVKKIRFSFQRRWDLYKEDSSYNLDTTGLFGLTNASSVTSLTKAQPYRGMTPGWLGNVFTSRRRFSFNGRATYSGGRANTLLNELYTGGVGGFPGSTSSSQLNQIVVVGTARRPVLTGDGTITVHAARKLDIVENNSYSDLRIDGNNTYAQYRAATQQLTELNFQFLGVRLFTTSVDAQYHLAAKFTAYVGYQYSDRLIRSIESGTQTTTVGGSSPGGAPPSSGGGSSGAGGSGGSNNADGAVSGQLYRQSNHLTAAITGFNWTPWAGLRVHVQGEFGRNADPFTPVSERNYHAVDGRVQYKMKTIQLTAVYREKYNNNSVSLSAYSSKSRNYSGSASWTGRSWMTLDASYTYLHLNTVGGIAFFAGSPQPSEITGDDSVFVSNIHSANLMARFSLPRRVELSLGYGLTRDVGDGRSSNAGPSNAVSTLLYSVQTFPLTYQSPSARLSVRLSEKLRFNIGYQYYGYKEQFGLLSAYQNYRANTGYTSLLFSF